MKTEPNELAMPDPRRAAPVSFTNQWPEQLPGGLTKREHIAIAAMQGILSGMQAVLGEIDDHDLKLCSMLSVKQADTLIAELNKEKP